MPFVPGLTGKPNVLRWSEWQPTQSETCSTRYSPRASRAGVGSIFSVLAGWAAGFFSESQVNAPAASASTTSNSPPRTFSKVFMRSPSAMEVTFMLPEFNRKKRGETEAREPVQSPAMTSFTLPLPGDFYAAVPLRWLGRDPESRTERVDGRSMAKALDFDGTPAVLRIDLDAAAARCRVDPRLSAEGKRAAREAAVRMLGIGFDPAPFERRAALDRHVRRLIAGRRGLRVPLTASVFEALVWTIAGQQVNLAFAYRLRRVLIELTGKRTG